MSKDDKSEGTPGGFADVLDGLMRKSRHRRTPGAVSRVSGVPKATIVNWLEGRVAKPRSLEQLQAVVRALQLGSDEAARLLSAGGHRFASAGLHGSSARIPFIPQSMLGRETELEAVQQTLRNGTRLLTIVGTGGVGKTRLAIAALETLAPEFAGTTWVSLIGAHGDNKLLAALVDALRVAEVGTTPTVDAVVRALGGRPHLLVIDNAEHVPETAETLAHMLSLASNVQCLVTSRTRLDLRAEHVLRLSTLATPGPAERAHFPDLLAYPSIALFVERMRSSDAAFVLTSANAAAVASVCSKLDGIPLAIELAAARAKILGVAGVDERLDRRFALLSTGSEDFAPRHRTLSNTISWSYNLLSEQERRAFRRLGVFSQTWQLRAAAAVMDTDENVALDIVASLVDKNLLEVEVQPDSTARFGMLQTIREYALERLALEDEAGPVAMRHVGHFALRSSEFNNTFLTMPTSKWLAEVDFERDNFREALQRSLCDDGADDETILHGVAIAANLGRFWWERGALREGLDWLEMALARAARAPVALAARCELQVGFMLNLYGRHVTAELVLERAAENFRSLEDNDALMHAENALGLAEMWNGHSSADRYVSARNRFQRVLTYRLSTKSERGAAVALHNLGQLEGMCFLEVEQGRHNLQQSLPAFRSSGDQQGVARTFEILAKLSCYARELERGLVEANESVAQAQALDNQLCLGEALAIRARILADLGDEAAAVASLGIVYRMLPNTFHLGLIAQFLEACARVLGAPYAAGFLGQAELLRRRDRMRLPLEQLEYDQLMEALVRTAGDRAAYARGLADTVDTTLQMTRGIFEVTS